MDMRRKTSAEERTFLPKDETVSPPRPHRQQTSSMRLFLSYKDEDATSGGRGGGSADGSLPHGEEREARLELRATAIPLLLDTL